MDAKKNCYNCEHLEWGYGDVNDPEGWICNNRDYKNDKEEDAHITKMELRSYLLKSKKCCELKGYKNN